MKNLFIYILILFFLFACAPAEDDDDGGGPAPTTTGTTTVTDPDDPPVIPDEPVSTDVIPSFAVKIGDNFYFSDGENLELWKTGHVEKSGPMKFSADNILYTLDETGTTTATQELLLTPEKIKNTDAGLFYCVEIPPDVAYSMGALYDTYTEIYRDNVLISEWINNNYECRGVVSVGSEVFVIDENGCYHNVNGVFENVTNISDNNFVVHDFDTLNSRVYFNNNLESYFYNYIFAAGEWLNFSGLNYSENGYTWNETDGLTELATALQDFAVSPYPVTPELPNGEAPVLLAVGDYSDKLFWIECNSGWLFEYNPVFDTLTQTYRLYNGDGLHISGILKRETLKPLLVENYLYFSNDNSIYRLDVESGFISIFYAGSGEVVKYD